MELVPSDPSWPSVFERLATPAREACGPLAVAIEHVGSTAVPELHAKPIIDIAVGLSRFAASEAVIAALSSLGMDFRGDHCEEGGLFFVVEDAPDHRIAHVHAVTYGGRQWLSYIALRDLLRVDTHTRVAYEDLKKRLAQQVPNDRRAYTAGKGAFFAPLLASIDVENQLVTQGR